MVVSWRNMHVLIGGSHGLGPCSEMINQSNVRMCDVNHRPCPRIGFAVTNHRPILSGLPRCTLPVPLWLIQILVPNSELPFFPNTSFLIVSAHQFCR